MEIIGAVVGAIATAAVTTALSKLTTVTSCGVKVQRQVDSLISEVGAVDSLLADVGRKGRSVLQTKSLEQLRCLACEIEDCVDLFHAGKTNGFADKIDNLNTKSVHMRKQIKDYLEMAQLLAAGNPHGAVQTTQQELVDLEVAQWAAVGAGAPVVPTPRELQDLLHDPAQKDWLAKNLKYLLYFCFFPPEHPFNANLLKRVVLAEGLVERDNVADDILEILVRANIISSTKTRIDGKVETCQHTTPMHAFISENSKSLNFLSVCDGNTGSTELAKASRISVHSSANVQLDWPQHLPRLRTLGVFPADKAGASANSYEDVLQFSRYEVLRVLDLKKIEDLTDDHLDDIVDIHGLVLMKYMSLNLGQLKGVSAKISKLNQLETLDLSGNHTLTLFEEVLFLPNLKHLLGRFYLSKSESFKGHSELEKFLPNRSKLETLEGFVTGTRYGFQDMMGLMKKLSKVKIWCTLDKLFGLRQSVLSEAIRKFIGKSTDQPHCTRSLSIDFTEYHTCIAEIKEVDDSRLDSLELQGKLAKLPQFVSGLSDIVELCLRSTGLTWVVILDGLKNVSGLKYLMLVEDNLEHFDVKIVPEEEADPLRSIERVSIVSTPRLDITIPDETLPLLVSLRILCKALNVSPATSCIKISHMEKLKEIALHPLVDVGIKTQWLLATNDHPQKPVLVTDPLIDKMQTSSNTYKSTM